MVHVFVVLACAQEKMFKATMAMPVESVARPLNMDPTARSLFNDEEKVEAKQPYQFFNRCEADFLDMMSDNRDFMEMMINDSQVVDPQDPYYMHEEDTPSQQETNEVRPNTRRTASCIFDTPPAKPVTISPPHVALNAN